jgi:microfibrillar-associated protein 1
MPQAIYRRGVAPAEQLNVSSSSDDDEPEKVQERQVDKRLQRLANATETSDRQRLRQRTVDNDLEVVEIKPRRRIPEHEPEVPEKSLSPLRPAKPESSSDYTSDSEESEGEIAYPVLMKPVFVPKVSRETILEQERKRIEEEELEKEKSRQLEKRKQESSDMVLEALRNAEISKSSEKIDDTDGLDEEEEFQAWKLRELIRIKRDREQRAYRLVDEEDIERRRQMTDDQIKEENILDGKLGVEKKKMRFLQKYYHKGAFYNDDEKVGVALAKTDALAPTLEDHADRTVLPSVLQVKNFGKHGRTKYTHLVDQDTTGVLEINLVGFCLVKRNTTFGSFQDGWFEIRI